MDSLLRVFTLLFILYELVVASYPSIKYDKEYNKLIVIIDLVYFLFVIVALFNGYPIVLWIIVLSYFTAYIKSIENNEGENYLFNKKWVAFDAYLNAIILFYLLYQITES